MANRFSERLSLLLQQNSMTQKCLAEKAGVTEAAMSHYLKGDRTPRASVLARIAEALNTTTDYLMGGNESDHVSELGYAKRLIARNVRQMSKEEKMEIINILMSDN
jgi:transcriptional regulator with XRE-family HTH domain